MIWLLLNVVKTMVFACQIACVLFLTWILQTASKPLWLLRSCFLLASLLPSRPAAKPAVQLPWRMGAIPSRTMQSTKPLFVIVPLEQIWNSGRVKVYTRLRAFVYNFTRTRQHEEAMHLARMFHDCSLIQQNAPICGS